jgi:two-component system, NtrC family, response regulator HydG
VSISFKTDPCREPSSVLIVDDDKATGDFFATVLRAAGYTVATSRSFSDAKEQLANQIYNVVLVDIQLDERDGTDLLPIVKKHLPSAEVVFVTGHGSIDTTVQAIHDGAFDYLSKPLDLADIREELLKTVGRAVKYHPVNAEFTESTATGPWPTPTIVGKSTQMVNVYRAIARAARTREHVLITGESGTGKELVAHALHTKGPWASRPFVTVNCGALTETLLESELFGHVRGSFTGAIGNKKGLFEEAHGGTIFLDEIGDISLNLQVKLLRALQEKEIKPVGATESRHVDVRVIAATHRDLFAMVHEGKFREDLYYRLRVITLDLPPLRTRVQDIPDLMEYFLNKFAQRLGKPNLALSDEARNVLLGYPWPGNIREMENAFGRAAALSVTNVLFPEDFPPEILLYQRDHSHAVDIALEAAPVEPGMFPRLMPVPQSSRLMEVFPHVVSGLILDKKLRSLEEVEKEHILETLQNVGFNRTKAAEILGIDRVTLYRKASKYGFLTKRRTETQTETTGMVEEAN